MRIALITMLSVLILLGCFKEDKPKYEGLTLKTWVERLDSNDPAIRIDALRVIESIGAKARPAEDYVRAVARNDPNTEVAIQAIEALEAMGATVVEFSDFVGLYNSPIIPSEDDDVETLIGGISEIDKDEMELLKHASGEDDLEYLLMLERGETETTQIDTTMIPINSDNFTEWVAAKRSSAISDIMHILNKPEVLRELLKIGNNLDREFAARRLAEQSGIDPSVIEALENILDDPDSTIRQAAAEALKNWKLP